MEYYKNASVIKIGAKSTSKTAFKWLEKQRGLSYPMDIKLWNSLNNIGVK
jgi:hypothetical protein